MKTFTAFALREMGSQQRLVESSLCVCECVLGVSSLVPPTQYRKKEWETTKEETFELVLASKL